MTRQLEAPGFGLEFDLEIGLDLLGIARVELGKRLTVDRQYWLVHR